jgi:predicted TIM-barrel fold metal-dependent hydrolase
MINGMFVVDAVVHPYDFSAANVLDNPVAKITYEQIWASMHAVFPPERVVSRRAACTDWSTDVVTETLFRETATDMAAHHYLTLNTWFRDGLVSRAKNVEIARRWPQRYVSYVGVDPTQGVEQCIREMKDQVAEIPGAVGLKMYPHQVYPFRSWRMDDPKVAYPLYEAAGELGLKVIAIHKALPLGPVPMDPYRVGDLDCAAMDFPDLNFEIVHSGVAFVEETAWALGRFPNVYGNLEVTTFMLANQPRRFGEVLAQFIAAGGEDKVMWAATMPNVVDCQWLLERFVDYELPADVAERFGLELTRQQKEKILGLNYLRMIGLGLEEAKQRVADDEFAAYNDGELEPWGTAWHAASPELFA